MRRAGESVGEVRDREVAGVWRVFRVRGAAARAAFGQIVAGFVSTAGVADLWESAGRGWIKVSLLESVLLLWRE